MAVSIPQVVTEDRASGALVIDGSLKFDQSKSQYLTFTPTTTGNRRTWTFSCWFKKMEESANRVIFSSYGSTPWTAIQTTGSGDGRIQATFDAGVSGGYYTDAAYRDNGWYHLVWSVDTTRSTDPDKSKLYINGVLQTYGSNAHPSLNEETPINLLSRAMYIGYTPNQMFDGHMSQCYLIDGQALGPEYFGYTDQLTGVWRPKKFRAEGTTLNDGTTFSSNMTGATNATNGFNGSLANYMVNSDGTIPMVLTATFKNVHSFRYYTSNSSAHDVSFNGGAAYRDAASTGWRTIPDPPSTITSISWIHSVTSATAQVEAVEINGEILLDSTTRNLAFGTNGFYLPMDGNSPIGQDQSGNGNDWTPINFGGSTDITKATGALPILNTLGGTVARAGVFGSEVSKYYTTTASTNTSNGFVFENEGTKPTLSFVRGGTYTFNYSASPSHPLYLSSLQNGKHNSKAYSVSFDGTGDYLSVPDHADLQFGTSAFTIECYVWFNSYNSVTYPSIISKYTGGTTSWIMRVKNDGKVIYYDGGGSNNESTSTPIGLNKWHHIAMVREGTGSNQAKMYVDGKLVITTTDATDYTDTQVITIGAQNTSANNALNGYMSNVRIIKGTALYTSDFTPPQTTLTNVTNTKLLCCQDSNAATDAVIPSGSITVGGDAAASQARQPFLYDNNHGNFGVNTATSNVTKITVPHLAADTLYYYCGSHGNMGNSISVTTDETKADPYAWKNVLAMSLVGGSGSDSSDQVNCNSSAKTITTGGSPAEDKDSTFYGSCTDFSASSTTGFYPTGAQSDLTFGTNDFTIEFWFKPTTTSRQYMTDFRNNGSGSGSGNNKPFVIFADNGSDGTGTRIRYANDTSSPNMDLLGGVGLPPSNTWHHLAIVRSSGTVYGYLNGVLHNSATDNTNYSTNDSVTIGNSSGVSLVFAGSLQDYRIYNGVAKYTSNFIPAASNPDILPDTPSGVATKSQLTKITDGAVNFDGNGTETSTGLTVTTNIDWSSDFTVEGFIYPNTNGPYGMIFDCWNGNTSGTGFYVWMRGNNSIDLLENSTTHYSFEWCPAGSISTKKWSHFAIVRSSNVLDMYIDGVKKSSSYTITDSWSSSRGGIIGSGSGNNTMKALDGFMSNVRISQTAVYTSNFTPPATSLSSLGADTKVLGLKSQQSVTSTEVGTITDIGGTAATNFNPFTTDINTVRGQEGAYATFDPLQKNSGVTLSNGNIKLQTTTNAWKSTQTTIPMKTGKYYWEFGPYLWRDSNNHCQPGVAAAGLGNAYEMGQQNFSAFYHYSGTRYFNASQSSFGAAWNDSETNIIGIAFDADTRKVWFSKNGVWQGSGNPSAGTNEAGIINLYLDGTYYPTLGSYGSLNGGGADANFGQKPFKFPPPDGFQPLTSSTVRPDTVVPRPDQYVGATLYTGNAGTKSIDVGHKPDFVWVKARTGSARSHFLFDSVRGVQKFLQTDGAAGESNADATSLTSFNNNGFTTGARAGMNENSVNYVAWTWKAGGNKNTFNVDDVGYATAAAAGLTAGDSSSVTGCSIGTKQGFSIIKYSGANTTQQIPHGLGQAPRLCIVKNLTDGSTNWVTSAGGSGGIFSDSVMFLNTTDANNAGLDGYWGGTSANSTVVYVGGNQQYTNQDSKNYIMYNWIDVPGLQKFGTYEGTGVAGNYVHLGFRPALIWIKNADTTAIQNWGIIDSTRSYANVGNHTLATNLSSVESAFGGGESVFGASNKIDLLSDGFALRETTGFGNASGITFIYCAWAEAPSFNLYGATSNAR